MPCAAKLDANEPKFVDGKVETISELKEAIAAYQEAGLCASAYDSDVGGMQLPWMMDQALNGMFVCANNPAHIYLFLTQGVANMLNACGSDELKRKYLPDLVEGNWFGTMCLSEPQAGSSLADIRTKADLNADGSYSISGTKMWISGGEQDITENIIHMVLAKIPGSPPGVKGISLFLVPKNRVNDDGSNGDFNNIALAGLNHKMGCRGATNCLLNFGESGDSIGYLVGEPNQGLANMFHMMNEARISVGMSAVMTGLGGYYPHSAFHQIFPLRIHKSCQEKNFSHQKNFIHNHASRRFHQISACNFVSSLVLTIRILDNSSFLVQLP